MDVRKQKVIIEYIDGDWYTMFDDGTIQIFGSAQQAYRDVMKLAKRGNKDATITKIEWRNTPAGFVPPKS